MVLVPECEGYDESMRSDFEDWDFFLSTLETIPEAISTSRLFGWENEIIHMIKNNQKLSESANDFIKNPSYGDGGMASAVRIASIIF